MGTGINVWRKLSEFSSSTLTANKEDPVRRFGDQAEFQFGLSAHDKILVLLLAPFALCALFPEAMLPFWLALLEHSCFARAAMQHRFWIAQGRQWLTTLQLHCV